MVIGVGVDVVDVERFRASLTRTPTMRARVFTPAELEHVASKYDPVLSLAARFAAREAVMKAMGLGLGAFGFHDASVRIDSAGAPHLIIGGQAAALATDRGIDTWHLSLAHDGGMATAMVVASGPL